LKPDDEAESGLYFAAVKSSGQTLKIFKLTVDCSSVNIGAVESDFYTSGFKPDSSLNERFTLYGKELSRSDFMEQASLLPLFPSYSIPM
jgi:hypothetical protein